MRPFGAIILSYWVAGLTQIPDLSCPRLAQKPDPSMVWLGPAPMRMAQTLTSAQPADLNPDSIPIRFRVDPGASGGTCETFWPLGEKSLFGGLLSKSLGDKVWKETRESLILTSEGLR